MLQRQPFSTPSSIDSADYSPEISPKKGSVGRVVSLEEGEEIKEDVDGMKLDREHTMRKAASSSDVSKEPGTNIDMLR